MLQRQGLFTSRDERQRRESASAPAAPPAAGPTETTGRTSESARAEQARGAAPTPAPTPAPARTDEQAKSRLIVGPDIKLKSAEITDCDTLVVEGRIEATLDARVMQIAETGTIVGTVSVDIAEVRGHFEGELTVRKTLVIHPTGRVSGKIRYGKVVIEEGGEITGEIGTLGAAKPAVALAGGQRTAESA
ncbi:MAG: polymer-forming cytoskeletal protein [Burkholderiales bacterium]|nr:polymer-forming cytoskeletal protein [Burkholderiales bacterium]